MKQTPEQKLQDEIARDLQVEIAKRYPMDNPESNVLVQHLIKAQQDAFLDGITYAFQMVEAKTKAK